MILRKPYAFLIKHFKLIHIMLSILLGYVCYRTWMVSDFFSKYAETKVKVSYFDFVSSKYIPFFLYFMIALIIVISIVIAVLMRKKGKSVIYYIFNAIVYSVLTILLLYLSSVLRDLWHVKIETRTAKIISDIVSVAFFVQIPCLLITLTRAVGFNIKQFNFKKDLIEFSSTDEDREEFEFEINIDKEDVRAAVRKRIRLFKYTYKENKAIFNTLFATVVAAILIFIGFAYFTREKVYVENQTFSSNYFDMKIVDSYKTNTNYKGEEISGKYSYIIVKLRVKNKTQNEMGMTIENTTLKVNDYISYSPTKLMYDQFAEFGTPYYQQKLKADEVREFMIVYQIDKIYYNNNMTFQYLYSITSSNNEVNYNYLKVKLSPSMKGEITDVETAKLNEKLVFKGSLLKNSNITIKDIDIKDNYYYDYIDCVSGKCVNRAGVIKSPLDKSYELAVMRIHFEFALDNEMDRGFSKESFITRYGSIRFIVDGNEYEHKIELVDLTPHAISDYIYVSVRKKLELADTIYLDFTIRDKKYTYIIKESLLANSEIADSNK